MCRFEEKSRVKYRVELTEYLGCRQFKQRKLRGPCKPDQRQKEHDEAKNIDVLHVKVSMS